MAALTPWPQHQRVSLIRVQTGMHLDLSEPQSHSGMAAVIPLACEREQNISTVYKLSKSLHLFLLYPSSSAYQNTFKQMHTQLMLLLCPYIFTYIFTVLLPIFSHHIFTLIIYMFECSRFTFTPTVSYLLVVSTIFFSSVLLVIYLCIICFVFSSERRLSGPTSGHHLL